MNHWQISLTIIAALFASLAVAEDFKTIKGKEYKNAKVSHVDPDGIVLITKSGISKVYFTELPKEVQERFRYDATEGDEYARKQNQALEQGNKELLQEEKLGQMRWISGKVISKSDNALLVECSGEGSSGHSDAATGRVVLRGHPDFAALAEGDRVAESGVVIPATQWEIPPYNMYNRFFHAYRVPTKFGPASAVVKTESAVRPTDTSNQTPTPTKSPYR